jgi:D-sedoheptulose 7-phosphate isomerase
VQRIRESAAVAEAMAADEVFQQTLREAANTIVQALRQGKKVLFFGNGGSAADAQHLAAELAGRYRRERQGLPGFALTTNISTLTAIGNDYDYSQVFARQIEALGTAGDVAVAISTSGLSDNVLRAVESARERGLKTMALTGKRGGKLRKLVDLCLSVPSEDTARIQEAYMLAGHILCEIAEEELFGN